MLEDTFMIGFSLSDASENDIQSINLFNQLCTKHVYGTRHDSDRLPEKQMLI